MKAHAIVRVPGPVDAVETLWHDRVRWPTWIDGFAHVVSVTEDWPAPGAVLEWASRPGGRGRVREKSLSRVPGGAHSTAVEDERLVGTQIVEFIVDSGGIVVHLTLDYRLKVRNPLTPVVDALFIRRSLAASLQRTLARFEVERAAD